MVVDTLTSPVILFFILGFVAALVRSDLTIPEAFAKAMSIYLMAAIGLKGGVEVAETGVSQMLIMAALAGIILSFALPFLAFALLRSFGRLPPVDAGAVAAHYGSVSVVTFVTAGEIYAARAIPSDGFMVGVMALMETPAIISGLLLARRFSEQIPIGQFAQSKSGSSNLLHEVLTNASVILLLGAFVIGMVAGRDGFEPVKPLFDVGFRGVLCLFLLDMGLVAARRLMQSRQVTMRLIALAFMLPLINGFIGLATGHLVGLGTGSTATLAILAASASYIAVPAAMRMALPEANPSIYLTMSLGISFPFNIMIGIPLFGNLAQLLV